MANTHPLAHPSQNELQHAPHFTVTMSNCSRQRPQRSSRLLWHENSRTCAIMGSPATRWYGTQLAVPSKNAVNLSGFESGPNKSYTAAVPSSEVVSPPSSPANRILHPMVRSALTNEPVLVVWSGSTSTVRPCQRSFRGNDLRTT